MFGSNSLFSCPAEDTAENDENREHKHNRDSVQGGFG